MTMIVIKFSSGHVDRRIVREDLYDNDEEIEKIISKLVQSWERTAEAAWLPVVGWERVNADYFPSDNTKRNAWRHVDGKVIVDVTKIETAPTSRISELEARIAALEGR